MYIIDCHKGVREGVKEGVIEEGGVQSRTPEHTLDLTQQEKRANMCYKYDYISQYFVLFFHIFFYYLILVNIFLLKILFDT